MSSRPPASTEPTGQPRPFESAIETRSNGAASAAGSSPRADRGVEQPRAVEVRGDPLLARGRADPLELRAVPDEPALAVLGVLDLDQRRRRVEQVAARLARREELVGGEAAVGADRGELHADERRGGAGLVPRRVALDADDDVVAGPAVELERELVRHRPGRDEQRGLLPEQRRDLLLQPQHARVLAVLVVADLGLGDRPPHRGGRAGDGVGAEVDDGRETSGSGIASEVAPRGRAARVVSTP